MSLGQTYVPWTDIFPWERHISLGQTYIPVMYVPRTYVPVTYVPMTHVPLVQMYVPGTDVCLWHRRMSLGCISLGRIPETYVFGMYVGHFQKI